MKNSTYGVDQNSMRRSKLIEFVVAGAQPAREQALGVPHC